MPNIRRESRKKKHKNTTRKKQHDFFVQKSVPDQFYTFAVSLINLLTKAYFVCRTTSCISLLIKVSEISIIVD